MLSSSRQSSLAMSRDRLARSMEKFERLALDAIEHIEYLREEKNEYEKKLRDLTRQAEEDRANSKHNEKLYESLQDDLKSQQAEIESLQRKRDEQEAMLREQFQTIERLEGELHGLTQKVTEHGDAASQRTSEIDELKGYVATLEERVTKTGQERDELREQLYTRERDDSQWVVKLNAQDHRKAEEEITKLVTKIDDIERQLSQSENGQVRQAEQEVAA